MQTFEKLILASVIIARTRIKKNTFGIEQLPLLHEEELGEVVAALMSLAEEGILSFKMGRITVSPTELELQILG